MPRIGRFWLSIGRYYTPDHTWSKIGPDGNVSVGMDDFGQKTAGTITRIRVFSTGHSVEQFKPFGSIETAKWTGPLSSPFSGTIKEVNQQVKADPKMINSDPYGKGWIIKITPAKLDDEINNLLTGESAVAWLKKDIIEIAKESY